MSLNRVAVLGPGRIGRQIALTFALGGWPVALVDLKDATADGAAAVFADARRGFFDYTGGRREVFESAKVRALLRQLRRHRSA